MKKDKMKVKTKNSELYEAELINHNKSVMKLKKHTSNDKDPKDLKDLKDLKEDNNFIKYPCEITEIKKVRSTR